MRIVRCGKHRCWINLEHVGDGSSVEFRQPFHQETCDGDVFIVTKVCSSYWPDSVCRDKVAVTNLRTGKISYVDAEREVVKVHAKVQLSE